VINAAGFNNRRCREVGSVDWVYQVNAGHPAQLAKLCHRQGLLFYHVSTEYVFGAKNGQGPFDEQVIPCPDGLYGLSKFQGDQAVLVWGGHVVRMSTLPDIFPYTVAATNIIASKVRMSTGCARFVRYVQHGLADSTRPPVLHIAGERRSIADFVRDELGTPGVQFQPWQDELCRPLDSSLTSLYRERQP
jgi:dTDP-4-dehydrorhamnose reductase